MSKIEPPIEQPGPFSVTGTEVLQDKWWLAFDDPVLNQFVEIALKENLVLAANWQQFLASLAAVRVERSLIWPQVEAFAGTSINQPESDFNDRNEIQTGFTASYEVDLWGRIRAGVQAEKFMAQAALYDYQSAAMTVSAETSLTWYELLSVREQLELINAQIKTNEDIVKLIRARFVTGQIRAVDILRQEQLLESTKSQKIIYETEIKLLENELAILLGQSPQNFRNLLVDSLPALPPLPQTGLPLELVRRRPDVQQAFTLVLAADREMAEAIRSRYPRISIGLEGRFSAGNYNNIFQNWAYSLAGNLVAPLIYGGRINAEVERTEAIKQQQLYLYGQSVLVAFKEVEDALISEINHTKRIEILERQLDLAEKTNGQLKIEFLNGMSDYLDVLYSLEQEQQLQRDLLDAKLTQLEIRIGLYRALAGGFQSESLENRNNN